MGRAEHLLAAVEATGAGAFVADTAPIIYRVERGADGRLVAACDPLFDAVEAEQLGCLVSAVSVAELLIDPFRAGPAAVSAIDAFLRQPSLASRRSTKSSLGPLRSSSRASESSAFPTH